MWEGNEGISAARVNRQGQEVIKEEPDVWRLWKSSLPNNKEPQTAGAVRCFKGENISFYAVLKKKYWVCWQEGLRAITLHEAVSLSHLQSPSLGWQLKVFWGLAQTHIKGLRGFVQVKDVFVPHQIFTSCWALLWRQMCRSRLLQMIIFSSTSRWCPRSRVQESPKSFCKLPTIVGLIILYLLYTADCL